MEWVNRELCKPNSIINRQVRYVRFGYVVISFSLVCPEISEKLDTPFLARIVPDHIHDPGLAVNGLRVSDLYWKRAFGPWKIPDSAP